MSTEIYYRHFVYCIVNLCHRVVLRCRDATFTLFATRSIRRFLLRDSGSMLSTGSCNFYPRNMVHIDPYLKKKRIKTFALVLADCRELRNTVGS